MLAIRFAIAIIPNVCTIEEIYVWRLSLIVKIGKLDANGLAMNSAVKIIITLK